MFISLCDAQGWVIFYEDPKFNPRRIACWAIKEYTNGNRKVTAIVHGGNGKLVDASSIGKVSAMLSGKNAQERLVAGDDVPPEPVRPETPPAPEPVPNLEEDDDEEEGDE